MKESERPGAPAMRRRILEHFGVPRDSRFAAHGARADLPLIIHRLDDDALTAQRLAWTRVLEDYKRLRRGGRKNTLTWVLDRIGWAATLLGGFALLDPALESLGDKVTVGGVGVLCLSGAWRLLSLRWKRQATAMIRECEIKLALIATENDHRGP